METFKENISVVNDTLKLFITLNVALISVFIGFHNQIFGAPKSPVLEIMIPVILLIGSLTASIIGIYPVSKQVNLLSPDEIRDYKTQRSKSKRFALAVASFCLISSFLSLLYVVVVRNI